MGAPRLSKSGEQKRQEVVDEIGGRKLQKHPALDKVARAVAVICDVDTAHVSLMEDDVQCVVGEVGMDEETFDREQTFCAHTIADNRVMVVEDAADDERFVDNPHVQGESGIRFYVGLPLVVDDVPVGTICALDTRPRSIDLAQRTELFGAVSAVESFLRVRYEYGADSFEEKVTGKLTAALASATAARFSGRLDETCRDFVVEVEDELRECVDFLDVKTPEPATRLGYEDTDVEE